MGRMAHRRRLVPSSMPERFCRVALSLLLAVPQTLIPVAAFAETPAAVDYSKLTPPVGEADWAARLELLKKRYSQLLVEAAKRLAAEDSATGAAAAEKFVKEQINPLQAAITAHRRILAMSSAGRKFAGGFDGAITETALLKNLLDCANEKNLKEPASGSDCLGRMVKTMVAGEPQTRGEGEKRFPWVGAAEAKLKVLESQASKLSADSNERKSLEVQIKELKAILDTAKELQATGGPMEVTAALTGEFKKVVAARGEGQSFAVSTEDLGKLRKSVADIKRAFTLEDTGDREANIVQAQALLGQAFDRMRKFQTSEANLPQIEIARSAAAKQVETQAGGPKGFKAIAVPTLRSDNGSYAGSDSIDERRRAMALFGQGAVSRFAGQSEFDRTKAGEEIKGLDRDGLMGRIDSNENLIRNAIENSFSNSKSALFGKFSRNVEFLANPWKAQQEITDQEQYNEVMSKGIQELEAAGFSDAAMYYRAKLDHLGRSWSAIGSGSLKHGTAFHAWELAKIPVDNRQMPWEQVPPSGPRVAQRVFYAEVNDDGRKVRGLVTEFAGGMMRFEGFQDKGQDHHLYVDVAANGEVTTGRIWTDAQGAVQRVHSATARDGKRIRAMLANTKEALLTQWGFKEDGSIASVQTINLETRHMTTANLEKGTITAIAADGTMSVASLKAQEKWKYLYGDLETAAATAAGEEPRREFKQREMVLADGTRIRNAGPHVQIVTPPTGDIRYQFHDFENELFAPPPATGSPDRHLEVVAQWERGRRARAAKIAEEIVGALGKNNENFRGKEGERRKQSLTEMLARIQTKDSAAPGGSRRVDLKINFDGRGQFSFLYELADGRKEAFQGRFASAIRMAHDAAELSAFQVGRPVVLEKQGDKLAPVEGLTHFSHGRRFMQFVSDGKNTTIRRQIYDQYEKTEGWAIAPYQVTYQREWVYKATAGRMSQSDFNKMWEWDGQHGDLMNYFDNKYAYKALTDPVKLREGSSWIGSSAAWVADLPVLKQVVEGAEFIVDGAVMAGQWGIEEIAEGFGADDLAESYRLARVGNMRQMPWIGDTDWMKKAADKALTEEGGADIARAYMGEGREKALKKEGFTHANADNPLEFNRMLMAEGQLGELSGAARDNFSFGNELNPILGEDHWLTKSWQVVSGIAKGAPLFIPVGQILQKFKMAKALVTPVTIAETTVKVGLMATFGMSFAENMNKISYDAYKGDWDAVKGRAPQMVFDLAMALAMGKQVKNNWGTIKQSSFDMYTKGKNWINRNKGNPTIVKAPPGNPGVVDPAVKAASPQNQALQPDIKAQNLGKAPPQQKGNQAAPIEQGGVKPVVPKAAPVEPARSPVRTTSLGTEGGMGTARSIGGNLNAAAGESLGGRSFNPKGNTTGTRTLTGDLRNLKTGTQGAKGAPKGQTYRPADVKAGPKGDPVVKPVPRGAPNAGPKAGPKPVVAETTGRGVGPKVTVPEVKPAVSPAGKGGATGAPVEVAAANFAPGQAVGPQGFVAKPPPGSAGPARTAAPKPLTPETRAPTKASGAPKVEVRGKAVPKGTAAPKPEIARVAGEEGAAAQAALRPGAKPPVERGGTLEPIKRSAKSQANVPEAKLLENLSEIRSRAQRMSAAQRQLGITKQQAAAVNKAHVKVNCPAGNCSGAQIRAKAQIMKDAGMTPKQIRGAMERGLAGEPPVKSASAAPELQGRGQSAGKPQRVRPSNGPKDASPRQQAADTVKRSLRQAERLRLEKGSAMEVANLEQAASKLIQEHGLTAGEVGYQAQGGRYLRAPKGSAKPAGTMEGTFESAKTPKAPKEGLPKRVAADTAGTLLTPEGWFNALETVNPMRWPGRILNVGKRLGSSITTRTPTFNRWAKSLGLKINEVSPNWLRRVGRGLSKKYNEYQGSRHVNNTLNYQSKMLKLRQKLSYMRGQKPVRAAGQSWVSHKWNQFRYLRARALGKIPGYGKLNERMLQKRIGNFKGRAKTARALAKEHLGRDVRNAGARGKVADGRYRAKWREAKKAGAFRRNWKRWAAEGLLMAGLIGGPYLYDKYMTRAPEVDDGEFIDIGDPNAEEEPMNPFSHEPNPSVIDNGTGDRTGVDSKDHTLTGDDTKNTYRAPDEDGSQTGGSPTGGAPTGGASPSGSAGGGGGGGGGSGGGGGGGGSGGGGGGGGAAPAGAAGNEQASGPAPNWNAPAGKTALAMNARPIPGLVQQNADGMPGFGMPWAPPGGSGADRKMPAGVVGGRVVLGEKSALPQYQFSTSGPSSSLAQLWPFAPRDPFAGVEKKGRSQQVAPEPAPRINDAPSDQRAPAAASRVPSQDEELRYDLMKTFLRPARHIQSGHPGSAPEPAKGAGLALLLQMLALAGGIYLWRFSNIGYVLGLRRRDYYGRD